MSNSEKKSKILEYNMKRVMRKGRNHCLSQRQHLTSDLIRAQLHMKIPQN